MHVSDDDGVRTVTFDRPDARNALTPDIAADLADTVDAVAVDTHDAVVLAGEGPAFSAGGDIEAMAAREETAAEGYDRIRATFGRLAESVLECPVPVLARVHGDAVGAGLSLVAVSDIAVAATDARFGAAFVHVGLIPDTGGTVLLPRLVGLRAAKRLVFTGDLVSASEAADLGLVSAAVPADELDDRVEGFLETFRARPTETIALAKEGLHGVLGNGIGEGLGYEAQLEALAADSDAHEEGVAAFLEDRDPDFD
ncbi:MAG: enoyl-CoA hydratase/isomerase family protein [Halobacteriaceae archaeon]